MNAHNVLTPEDTADWYDIVKILPSNKYIVGDTREDIALLKVDLNDTVTAVCIGSHEPDVGDLVTVTGWGALSCK